MFDPFAKELETADILMMSRPRAWFIPIIIFAWLCSMAFPSVAAYGLIVKGKALDFDGMSLAVAASSVMLGIVFPLVLSLLALRVLCRKPSLVATRDGLHLVVIFGYFVPWTAIGRIYVNRNGSGVRSLFIEYARGSMRSSLFGRAWNLFNFFGRDVLGASGAFLDMPVEDVVDFLEQCRADHS